MHDRAPGPDAVERVQTDAEDSISARLTLPVAAPISRPGTARFPIAFETPGEHLRNALQLIELELGELALIPRNGATIRELDRRLELFAALRARVSRALHQLEVADRIDAKAEQLRRERHQLRQEARGIELTDKGRTALRVIGQADGDGPPPDHWTCPGCGREHGGGPCPEVTP